jgi:hypothetical protein
MSSQNFYNELRKNNKSAKSNRQIQSARSTSSQPGTLINYNKREKLKSLLIEKFTKKYNLKTNEPLIEQEVKSFINKEKLTEKDLKNLDGKIYDLIKKKYSLQQLENHLKGDENINDRLSNMGDYMDEEKKRVQTAYSRRCDDDAMSVRSGLSGASKLSQVKPRKKELDDDDLDNISCVSHREPVNRINFGNEKDEWNAINKYNQQVFETDKVNERLKDQEIKRRTKEDLDNQIKQKMILQNEERMKNKEYDKITIDHVQVMNKKEEERKKQQREKMLREKENRDAQRLDEKKRKKVEEKKNKKYERELRK